MVSWCRSIEPHPVVWGYMNKEMMYHQGWGFLSGTSVEHANALLILVWLSYTSRFGICLYMLPILKSYGHCYLTSSSGICYLGTLVAIEYGSPGPPLWYYFTPLSTQLYTSILVIEEYIDVLTNRTS
jgi:hypothetical protein